MLLMLRQCSTCRMPPAVANGVWHSLSLPSPQLSSVACLLPVNESSAACSACGAYSGKRVSAQPSEVSVGEWQGQAACVCVSVRR